MVYVKIVIGSLIWGVILWGIGDYLLEKDRERICSSEIRKETPELVVVKENCLATAEVYAFNEEYGTASWYYLLAGDLDKNINEIEEKISENFYMNIGHTYVLKNNLEKAEKIYRDFIFSNSGGYGYRDVDVMMKEDYIILSHIYPDEKEQLDKGLKLWKRLYTPVGKMVDLLTKYEKVEYDDNTTEAIALLKELVVYAEAYKDEEQVEYVKWVEALAELYYEEDKYEEAILYYKKAAMLYEKDESQRLAYADSLFWIAKSYYYLLEYKESIRYYKKSLPMYVEAETNSSYNIGYVYHNIGNSYRDEYSEKSQLEALKYYKKSIEHKEYHNPKEFDSIARSYNSLGDLYNDMNQYDKAKKAYENAIALEKKMLNEKDEEEIEETVNELDDLELYYENLSENYRALNEMNVSVEVQDEYLDFIEKNYGDYELTLARSYGNVANYFKYKDNFLSLKYYKKSLALLDEKRSNAILEKKNALSRRIVEQIVDLCREVEDDNSLAVECETMT